MRPPLAVALSVLLFGALSVSAASAREELGNFDVPAKLVKAINQAIAAKDWNAKVKIGWDPTHIQPTDITVAEAKAGKRPA